MKRNRLLNELVFRVLMPRRGTGVMRVEVANANRKDRPFMKLIAALIGMWLGRQGR